MSFTVINTSRLQQSFTKMVRMGKFSYPCQKMQINLQYNEGIFISCVATLRGFTALVGGHILAEL